MRPTATKPKPHAKLACPQCGPETGAIMVLRRRRSDDAPFWGCERFPRCKAAHGAHPDGKPLGIPGTVDVKAARKRAHEVLDQLWQSGRMHRGSVYGWLERVMKLGKGEGHIGRFDVAQCEQVITLATAFMAEDAANPLSAQRQDIRQRLTAAFGKNRRQARRSRQWLGAALGMPGTATVHELSADQCANALACLSKLEAERECQRIAFLQG